MCRVGGRLCQRHASTFSACTSPCAAFSSSPKVMALPMRKHSIGGDAATVDCPHQRRETCESRSVCGVGGVYALLAVPSRLTEQHDFQPPRPPRGQILARDGDAEARLIERPCLDVAQDLSGRGEAVAAAGNDAADIEAGGIGGWRRRRRRLGEYRDCCID